MRVKAVAALRSGNANEYVRRKVSACLLLLYLEPQVQYEASQIAAAEQAHAVRSLRLFCSCLVTTADSFPHFFL